MPVLNKCLLDFFKNSLKNEVCGLSNSLNSPGSEQYMLKKMSTNSNTWQAVEV